MLNLTLRQLRIFQAAAADLNFARAAKRLHLSQPAVSMQIRHMEDALGLTLFERDGRRVSLSEAGRAIYEASLGITSHFVELEWLAEQYKTADRGHVQIAALTTADYVLPELLAGFISQRQNISVTLRSGNGPEVLRYLEDNVVDFAIVGNPQTSPQISVEPVFDNAFVVVARGDYVAGAHSALPIGVLEREPLIVREATSAGRIAIEAFLGKHGVRPAVRLSLASDEAIKTAVRAGAGIAVLPLVAVQLELRAGELQVLPVEKFPLMRQWHLAMRRGKKLPASAEALRRLLQRELPGLAKMLLSASALRTARADTSRARNARVKLR